MFSAIGTILPFVMMITEFLKKNLGLSGVVLIIASWVIALIGAGVYGMTSGLAILEIILVGVGTGISANGGYELLKEIAEFIGKS